jgi:hypothetical protein
MATYNTTEELLAEAYVNMFVKGEVYIDLDELLGKSFDECLDMFSIALTGSDLLMEVSYRPVGVEPDGVLVLEVSGNIQAILEMEES